MTMEIKSFEGVGDLRFGMTRAQVRAVLGSRFRSLKKTPSSEHEHDSFFEAGFQVFYDQNGLCEAIEMGKPANPTFGGELIIGNPYSDARDLLLMADPELTEDDSGLVSEKTGIALYAPKPWENPPVEGVYIFPRGGK